MALVGRGFYSREGEFWKLGWLIKGAQRAGLGWEGWDAEPDTPQSSLDIKLFFKHQELSKIHLSTF